MASISAGSVSYEAFSKYMSPDSASSKRLIVEFNHSAFTDINNDCAPDILLHTTDGENQFIEIWMSARKDNRLSYFLSEINTLKLPENVFSFTLADFNLDGSIDILIGVNSATPGYYILLNRLDDHPAWDSDFCASGHTNFTYRLFSFDGQVLPTQLFTNDTGSIASSTEHFVFPTLRVADFNLDSKPDLLAAVNMNGTTRLVLFENVDDEPFSLRNSISVELPGCIIPSFVDLIDDGLLFN